MGNAQAHHNLSVMYHYGHGVDKNKEREVYHAEESAICGNPDSRVFLGCEEWGNGNIERAVKHWIIAAKQGDDESMKALMDAFKKGCIGKEDLTTTTTLRAHQAAIDATKSPQREAAEAFLRNQNNIQDRYNHYVSSVKRSEEHTESHSEMRHGAEAELEDNPMRMRMPDPEQSELV